MPGGLRPIAAAGLFTPISRVRPRMKRAGLSPDLLAREWAAEMARFPPDEEAVEGAEGRTQSDSALSRPDPQKPTQPDRTD